MAEQELQVLPSAAQRKVSDSEHRGPRVPNVCGGQGPGHRAPDPRTPAPSLPLSHSLPTITSSSPLTGFPEMGQIVFKPAHWINHQPQEMTSQWPHQGTFPRGPAWTDTQYPWGESHVGVGQEPG